MIKIDPKHIAELNNGNIPAGLDHELLEDIQEMLELDGEATIVFYPSDDCTYAAIDDGELFDDWEEEGRAVITAQDQISRL